MLKKTSEKSSGRRIAMIVAVVILVVAGGFWLWLIKTPDPVPMEQTPITKPSKIQRPVKDSPIIDYGNIEKDESLKGVMAKRKAAYGVEKSIDLIVKPEELLKIGGRIVPMQEILDKIHLERGDIIESNLASDQDRERILKARKARIGELSEAESRFELLEKLLKDPKASQKDKGMEALVREHAELRRNVAFFRKYKTMLKALTETRESIEHGNAAERAAALTALHTLKLEIEKLEKALSIPRVAEKQGEAYGIYIVRRGDNIWNIHFRFLKDYFSHRQIAIAPKSDEPDSRGLSSGVGKILKFSENMVYIYNLKERRLDVDLNLLQPLSKIVIFNMGEALALLNPIGFRQVNRVQFDGETLWIPSEQ